MAGLSLSEQLRIVSDPRPAEFNPDEEDWELLSGARLTQSRSYEDRGTGRRSAGKKVGVASSAGRRVLGEECEADQRYAGRPVSRRELFGCGENGECFLSVLPSPSSPTSLPLCVSVCVSVCVKERGGQKRKRGCEREECRETKCV